MTYGEVTEAIYFRSIGGNRWEFGCDSEYAGLIEFGTPQFPAFPFISSTLWENDKLILDSAKRGCLDALGCR